MDIIASLMVLPNRMCFPLIDQVKVDEMRFPLPRVSVITVSVIMHLIISGIFVYPGFLSSKVKKN